MVFEIRSKNFHFNIKKLLKDKELVLMFSLTLLAYIILKLELIEVNYYRPDLWAHFIFGYAVNKFWRMTYLTKGLFKNTAIDFILSLTVHISKEIFDVIKNQNILAFDILDIIAALLGLLIEDIKFVILKRK